jgi:hypothetical protein
LSISGRSRNQFAGSNFYRRAHVAGWCAAVAGEKFSGQLVTEKTPKPEKPKVKNDPKHIAAARELRDRWLERVNADLSLLVSQSKCDVSRELPAPAPARVEVAAAMAALPQPIAA